jgi:hypothetical protein
MSWLKLQVLTQCQVDVSLATDWQQQDVTIHFIMTDDLHVGYWTRKVNVPLFKIDAVNTVIKYITFL